MTRESGNSYRFFSNRECEYFPCHKNADENKFNCLFCFCPLYSKKDCGGDFAWTDAGIKDCSNCLFPHAPENYDQVIKKLVIFLKISI